MIGIVVAVIVAAVVLVPICNSLTEGNGNEGGSGGDSGGGGESSYDGLVLNSLEDMYGEVGIVMPFKTYQIFEGDALADKDLSFGMDFIESLDGVRSEQLYMSTGQPVHCFYVDVYNQEGTNVFYITFDLDEKSDLNEGDPLVTMEMRFGISYLGDNQYSDYIQGKLENISAFSITIDDGILTYSYTATGVVQGPGTEETWTHSETFDLSSHYAELKYVSNEEVGWVPSGYTTMKFESTEDENPTYPTVYAKLADGSVFEVSVESMVDHDYFGDTVLIEVGNVVNGVLSGTAHITGEPGQYMDVSYEIPLVEVSEGIYSFTPDTDNPDPGYAVYGTWELVDYGGLNLTPEIYRIELGSQFMMSSSVDTDPTDYVAESGSSGESGGSSSGGNDLGTAGTIIGIIPVFVILAILMGAAGLFYQNRNGL